MKNFLVFILLTVALYSQDIKPNQEIYSTTPSIDITNKHLQENYKLDIFKKLKMILTGDIVKDDQKNIGNRAYTKFKIEF